MVVNINKLLEIEVNNGITDLSIPERIRVDSFTYANGLLWLVGSEEHGENKRTLVLTVKEREDFKIRAELPYLLLAQI